MAGWISVLFAAAGLLAGHTGARAQEPVDVSLVLAVDVSRSMSQRELAIQREGYAAALNHPDVVRAIGQGAYGRIAITMFEWAGDGSTNQVFDWTLVETGADADRLSALVLATRPVGLRRTSISGAVRHAMRRLDASPYEGFRKVIDISGDGPNNQGGPVLAARDEALGKRIVINGLPLMTSDGPGGGFNIADLDAYYGDCVIGGPGSFLVPVRSWEQFPEAVRRKLILEIGSLKLPPERAGGAGAEIVPVQALPAQPFRPAGESSDCLAGEKIWEERRWMFTDP
ncbi:DUF1194 domain-containing protein [Hoeflea olei]|uniref:VWFA domain-containing protein n=1 Tax=Hoeflea olei TaxID=1480615 RepID=A0A1C1YW05_9HYPH|nr:DUF1194 domain-containing protein [Hoeflea olei]OCW57580.1 hypothetical protein AWJ14_01805 [Hoeflea olei]